VLKLLTYRYFSEISFQHQFFGRNGFHKGEVNDIRLVYLQKTVSRKVRPHAAQCTPKGVSPFGRLDRNVILIPFYKTDGLMFQDNVQVPVLYHEVRSVLPRSM